MELQRLVHDRVPFRTGGGAPLAIIGQRQVQQVEQSDYFLSRGVVEIIERGQAAWEKFAIDHALGEAVDPAEAHAFGQFSQSIGDKALVARAERGQTIAHHNPFSQPAVEQTPLVARLAHHFGVVTFASNGKIDWIEGGEHVKVEELSLIGVTRVSAME